MSIKGFTPVLTLTALALGLACTSGVSPMAANRPPQPPPERPTNFQGPMTDGELGVGEGLPGDHGLPVAPTHADLEAPVVAGNLPVVSGRIGVLGTWNGVATFYPRNLEAGVKAHVYRNGGWITTTLAGKSDGTYSGALDLLPGESYWVEGPTAWIYTKDTFVDQANPRSRRPGLVANTGAGPTLTPTLTNLEPLGNGDEFEVAIPGHPYQTGTMNVANSGATSYSWTFTQYALAYQVASPDDTIHLSGLKYQYANNEAYWGLTRLRRVGLTAKDGDVLNFNVTMSDAMASPETVRANADFAALRARATQGLTLRYTPTLRKIAYFPGEESGQAPLGLRNFQILGSNGSDDKGSYSVGRLYDAWPKGFELYSALQRPVLAPGAQTTADVVVDVRRRQATAPTAQAKLALTLNQPTGATVGEGFAKSLVSDQTGVGLTPRLDWSVTGAPTASCVDVFEVYARDGQTRVAKVGRLRSWRTVHQRIPPGLLQAGHTYVFTLSVEYGTNPDFPQRTPLRPGTGYERTGIISGLIQP